MNLANKTAIITGGNQGLGRQIALRFIREGASVVICARSGDKLSEVKRELEHAAGPGQRALAMTADVTSEADMIRVAKDTAAALGRIDILVNCAGAAGPRGALEEVNWQEWKEAVEINLYGTAIACRAVLPIMKAQSGGKIINISGGGATKPLPHLSAYAASKAAVVRFTETLALELRDWHIDVNAVAPGVLNTRLVDDFMQAGEDKLGASYFAEVARQKADGQPAFDLATGLCVFLGSAAGDGITGRLLSANWDPWEQLQEHREKLMSGDVYTLRRILPEDRGLPWGRGKS